MNHGLIMNASEAALYLNDKSWTNAADGRFVLNGNLSQLTNFIQVTLDGLTWSNAGTIELQNVWTEFMRSSSTKTWSNTGTLIVNDSNLTFNGKFTSDDVRNVRRTNSSIGIGGVMDNTGRTFTFTSETGSYGVTRDGHIVGGTLVSTGPNARLGSGGGTLDGVTLVGDYQLGGVRHRARWASLC